jgi:hypothetical protein
MARRAGTTTSSCAGRPLLAGPSSVPRARQTSGLRWNYGEPRSTALLPPNHPAHPQPASGSTELDLDPGAVLADGPRPRHRPHHWYGRVYRRGSCAIDPALTPDFRALVPTSRTPRPDIAYCLARVAGGAAPSRKYDPRGNRAEPVIQPHTVADDLRRVSMTLIRPQRHHTRRTGPCPKTYQNPIPPYPDNLTVHRSARRILLCLDDSGGGPGHSWRRAVSECSPWTPTTRDGDPMTSSHTTGFHTTGDTQRSTGPDRQLERQARSTAVAPRAVRLHQLAGEADRSALSHRHRPLLPDRVLPLVTFAGGELEGHSAGA